MNGFIGKRCLGLAVGLVLFIAQSSMKTLALDAQTHEGVKFQKLSIERILSEERRRAEFFFRSHFQPGKGPNDSSAFSLLKYLREKSDTAMSKMRSLPLAEIVSDKKLLRSARVSYDETKQKWEAMWLKPSILHFGMLLRPALDQRVEPGESFAFESGGVEMFVSKDAKEHLTFSQQGNSFELGAIQLKRLLERKVHAQEMTLFLDPKGNLILRAQGQIATYLAQIKS